MQKMITICDICGRGSRPEDYFYSLTEDSKIVSYRYGDTRKLDVCPECMDRIIAICKKDRGEQK